MRRGTLLKGALTVVGAVLLSTLGIMASDTLRDIDINLANVSGGKGAICQTGMVPISVDGNIICTDAYEASPGDDCPHKEPKSNIESEQNANSPKCLAVSAAGTRPWTFISLAQAQRVCASVGKRLPNADEWYAIALGTNPATCVIDAREPQRSGIADCVSTVGAYDLVGNVWEWVDETVTGASYEGRPLPPEGYVTSVDASGIAITSLSEPNELYGSDYFWSKQEGVFGMIRGGYYGSGSDAGLYALNASVPTSFATQGVGFRCVDDII
jgi:formylglycine-generating enzyme required for sulfatase activity